MKLIYNDIDLYWVWVDSKDSELKLSPCFEDRLVAIKWIFDIVDKIKAVDDYEHAMALRRAIDLYIKNCERTNISQG